ILVKDWNTVNEIHTWHDQSDPGSLVLLPLEPGPSTDSSGDHPLSNRLSAEGPAQRWIDALLRGFEVLHPSGRVLKRPTGAVFLAGGPSPSGPIRRRADLAALGHDIADQQNHLAAIVE